MRTDSDRVQDILEAIARIERRTDGGPAVFEGDEMLQTWVVHLKAAWQVVVRDLGPLRESVQRGP